MGVSTVGIVGGCGHVGLPLGLVLAQVGINVTIFDTNEAAVSTVMAGQMPFLEEGASELLEAALSSGKLAASTEPNSLAGVEVVVVVIGTPVDGHQNPDPNAVVAALVDCLEFLNSSQLVILRSTLFPGVTRRIEAMLQDAGLYVDVAFCPERIVEGQAINELKSLPQIIGARNESAALRAAELFEALGIVTYHVSPEEAELAKLFTNAWRYIKFAAANQFWLMANESGLDFSRIHAAITFEYPRAADMPGPGFAAGPCLFKDTAQLAAFTNNNFALGNAAMMVNEGQPLYIVDRIASRVALETSSVGILGMAFKRGSDDTRSSLAYKLKKILRFRAKEVLTTDPYVTTDASLLPLNEVLERADILIVATPHKEYREIEVGKPIFDVWNVRGHGSLI